jgi:hypothetical protein
MGWWRSFERPAAIALVVYTSASFAFVPVFPFAVVDMYARLGHRYEAAMPVVLIDGEQGDVRTLTDFRGLTPAALSTDGIPCSVGYIIDDLRNHLVEHVAAPDAPPGDTDVAFGWRRYHIDEDGVIVDEGLRVVATGTARRRR